MVIFLNVFQFYTQLSLAWDIMFLVPWFLLLKSQFLYVCFTSTTCSATWNLKFVQIPFLLFFKLYSSFKIELKLSTPRWSVSWCPMAKLGIFYVPSLYFHNTLHWYHLPGCLMTVNISSVPRIGLHIGDYQ